MITTENNSQTFDDAFVRTWAEKLRALTEAYRSARREHSPTDDAKIGIRQIGERMCELGNRDLMNRVYEAAGEDVAVDHIWDGITDGDHVVWVC